MLSADYVKQVSQVQPLKAITAKLLATDPASTAAAVEFVLEGLHLNKKLNKDVQAGRSRYRGP
jgi:magnesium chelatase subunit I